MIKSSKRKTTKETIINQASLLFAQKGKDSVTMNDIANFSGKSRRTLYFYFNNKRDVYIAVVESELDKIAKRLQKIVDLKMHPLKKLEVYILSHFEFVKEIVNSNNSFKIDFFRDLQRLEKIRLPIDMKEIKMIRQILSEGVSDGIFKEVSAQWTAMMVLYAMKGIEVAYLKEGIDLQIKEQMPKFMDIFLNGMLRKDD